MRFKAASCLPIFVFGLASVVIPRPSLHGQDPTSRPNADPLSNVLKKEVRLFLDLSPREIDAMGPAGVVKQCTELLNHTSDPAIRAKLYETCGEAHRLLGDDDSALRDFESAVALLPAEPGLKWKLARLQAKHGKLEQATALLKEVSKAHPEFVDGYVTSAGICALRGSYDEAHSLLDKALVLNPNCARAYHVRATLYFDQNMIEKAAVACEKCIQLDPCQYPYPHIPYLDCGSYYYHLRKYDKALSWLQLAHRLNPKCDRTVYTLFQIYLILGNHELALKYALLLAQLQPSNEGIYAVLIPAHLHLNDVREAIRLANLVLERNVRNPDSLARAAVAYEAIKNFGQAQKCYDLALQIDHENVMALKGMAAMFCGLSGPAQLDPQRAVATLQKLAPLVGEEECTVLEMRAVLQSQLGNFAEAKKLIRSAIRNCPPEFDLYPVLIQMQAVIDQSKPVTDEEFSRFRHVQ
jgi:tetratricopeptide (TPR) repeat protein